MRTSPARCGMRRFALPTLLIALLSVFAAALPANGQQKYPDRPIRIVVPFNAGGATDVIARVLSVPLGEVLGQSIVIENRGGGAGRARRLYPAARLERRDRQPRALQDPDLRRIQGLGADRRVGHLDQHHRGRPEEQHQNHRRHAGAGESQSGEAQLCEPRNRDDATARHGAAQAARRRQHHPRRLHRRGGRPCRRSWPARSSSARWRCPISTPR